MEGYGGGGEGGVAIILNHPKDADEHGRVEGIWKAPSAATIRPMSIENTHTVKPDSKIQIIL